MKLLPMKPSPPVTRRLVSFVTRVLAMVPVSSRRGFFPCRVGGVLRLGFRSCRVCWGS